MRFLLACCLLALGQQGYSQSSAVGSAPDQIEISPLLRYDWYPEFSYNYAGRVSTDYLKMQGLSWGINGNYKKALSSRNYLKAGIGYYRYSFTKLTNRNRFGSYDARNVNYPSDVYILYSTDRYSYNTLSINLALEHLFQLSTSTKLLAGVNLNHFFTLSRSYHIRLDDVNYVVDRKGYLGYSVNVSFGIVKQVGRFCIGPSVFVPVYDRWKKDKQFGEDENETRAKWFKGVGVGVVISKVLKN